MTYRVFTVNDGVAYWRYPDGSNRCFSQEDARLINAALTYCRDNFQWIEPEQETNREFKPSKEKLLTDLLAEAGSLLNAIRARDGTAYHRQLYSGFQSEYMQEDQFDGLVERIREALGGDILRATWNIGKNV